MQSLLRNTTNFASSLRVSTGLRASRTAAMSTSTSPLVKVTQQKPGVAIIEMQSGPVNALSLAHMHALRTTIQKLEDDHTCNAMILTSARKGIFSGGLDMSEFYNPDSVDIVRAFWREFQELFIVLYGTRLATVAAINGHCPAGGLLLALSCDYRVAVDSAKFTIGFNEAQFGLIAPEWFNHPLIQTIGGWQAERMLTIGQLINFQKAHSIGLINTLVPADKLMEQAVAEVDIMMTAVPFSRAMTKQRMRQGHIDWLEERREDDIEGFVVTTQSDMVQNALGKYLASLKAKSKPKAKL